MPSIEPLPQPNDLSNTSVVTWVLGLFLLVIGWLWRKSEGQSVAAVDLLNTRLTKAELDLKTAANMHQKCEEDRNDLRIKIAVNIAMSEDNETRLTTLENKLNKETTK